MQTDKFIKRAQEFIGSDGSVDRTVVVQQRPITAVLAGAAAFFVVSILLAIIGVDNIIVAGGLGGLALALATASMTKNYYLAGVGDQIQMIRLKQWSGQPEALHKTLARPLAVEPSKGLLTKGILLDGEKYVVSKLFEEELHALRQPV